MLEIILSIVSFACYVYLLNYPSYYPTETSLVLRSYGVLLNVDS